MLLLFQRLIHKPLFHENNVFPMGSKYVKYLPNTGVTNLHFAAQCLLVDSATHLAIIIFWKHHKTEIFENMWRSGFKESWRKEDNFSGYNYVDNFILVSYSSRYILDIIYRTQTIILWECFPHGVEVREVFTKYRGARIYILQYIKCLLTTHLAIILYFVKKNIKRRKKWL